MLCISLFPFFCFHILVLRDISGMHVFQERYMYIYRDDIRTFPVNDHMTLLTTTQQRGTYKRMYYVIA